MFGIPEASLCTKGIWNFPDFLGGSVWSHCVANVGLSLRDGWIDTARESISALPRGLGVIRMGPIFRSLQGEDLARPEAKV